MACSSCGGGKSSSSTAKPITAPVKVIDMTGRKLESVVSKLKK